VRPRRRPRCVTAVARARITAVDTISPARLSELPAILANVIDYEDSDEPALAIGGPEFSAISAQSWVRSHGEPMMLRDADQHFMLVYFGANKSVQMDGTTCWRITDVHEAARRFRDRLRVEGLDDNQ
jgi:hypothetical protein